MTAFDQQLSKAAPGLRPRRFTRLLLVAFIVLTFTVGTAQPSSAHATLVHSTPSANAVLDAAPTELRLSFTEPVNPELSTVSVTVGEQAIETVATSDTEDEAGLLATPVSPLPDGVVIARWRVVSSADGHVTEGIVVFGIGTGADPTSATFDQPSNGVDPVDAVLRWFSLASVVVIIGGLWTGVRLSRSGPGAAGERSRRLTETAARAALLLALVQLGYQLVVISSGSPNADVVFELLLSSRWGLLWWVRVALLLFIARPRASDRRLVGALTAGLVLTFSMGSHAAGLEEYRLASIVLDGFHLAAAGVWIGGLVSLLYATLPELRSGKRPSSPWVDFARPAAWSAVVLMSTGLFLTGRHTASFDAALRSGYGRTLLIKIVLAGAVALLGLGNWALIRHGGPPVTPIVQRLAEVGRGFVARFSNTPLGGFRAEIVVAVLALGGAAVLTATPPAIGPQFTPSAVIGPGTQSGESGDVLVGLSVTPNRPGQNLILVQPANMTRPEPAPIERVLVRVSFDGDDRGLRTLELAPRESGTWELLDPTLSSPGHWRIDVVVRRPGLDDRVTTFDWVLPASEVKPPIVSDTYWGSFMTVMAALAAAMLAWLLVTVGRRNRQERLAGTGVAEYQ